MPMYWCVLCIQRGFGARLKPHSRPTVVWSQWNVSAFPYVCFTTLSLCDRNHDHEGNSRVEAAEIRGGQPKDKALVQESERGEAIRKGKLF